MIIISDTHLTPKFDIDKFNYLKGIIARADWVIINGDFWDGELCTFDKFVWSRWRALFSLLKSKKTIYIYGNHDSREKCDERVSLFSIHQCDSFITEAGGLRLYIEHGDRIAPDGPIISLMSRITLEGRPIGGQTIALLAKIGLLLFGRLGLLVKEKRNNEQMKRWGRANLPESLFLVCGHTHLAELDLGTRFVNTGFIAYGYAQYLKIEDGEVVLVEERY